MKKIVKRRRTFRINNPLAFGILCAMILVLLAGITYALVAGIVSPAIVNYQVANATPSPAPTVAPITATPSPTVDPMEPTPTPTLEPGTTPAPTDAPPGALQGRIIGIDPARGFSSQIQGVSTKIYANRLNFAVATLVKERLEAEGATVVFTLSSVKDDKTAAERAKILNDGNVEFAIRIECNSVKSTETRGAMAWVPEKHDKKSDCDKLADMVLSAYIDATGLPLREIKDQSVINKTDETFLNNTKAPVFTLFLGHISNSTEDKKINDEEFQKTMAQGVVTGVFKYLGVNQ
ncbi:MAG: N-acetylmuramoyl-L-alanine amidase [Eubacteriales bacterium]|jgi:N-acetylmuramoyl-L-alanine amidase|nr:N-acetylmuramoyl-L-alanine amidase [Eubacteriales bacterium]